MQYLRQAEEGLVYLKIRFIWQPLKVGSQVLVWKHGAGLVLVGLLLATQRSSLLVCLPTALSHDLAAHSKCYESEVSGSLEV